MSKNIFILVPLIYFFIGQLHIQAQLTCSTGTTACITGFTRCNKTSVADVKVMLREVIDNNFFNTLQQTFDPIAKTKSTDGGQFTLNVKTPDQYNASKLALYFYHKCGLQFPFGDRYHARYLKNKCINDFQKLKTPCLMGEIQLYGTKDTIDIETESTTTNYRVITFKKSMQNSKKGKRNRNIF
uniref:Uncharacterized protein n=1 Tax=Parastrongyloides trichosuri TaxID=131310 RepID=A0A0N5A7I3_PARTI